MSLARFLLNIVTIVLLACIFYPACGFAEVDNAGWMTRFKPGECYSLLVEEEPVLQNYLFEFDETWQEFSALFSGNTDVLLKDGAQSAYSVCLMFLASSVLKWCQLAILF